MRFSPHPSQALLREWLHYDPETGIFTWRKECRHSRPLLGCRAGCQNNCGYWRIQLRGFTQLIASRLAWIYMTGSIPMGMEVDHSDRDASNDKWSNLRLATSSQQKMNRGIQTNSRSGLKGAYYHAAHKGKKWRSQLKVDGKFVFLGYFHSAQEAHEVYCKAAPLYYKQFAACPMVA